MSLVPVRPSGLGPWIVFLGSLLVLGVVLPALLVQQVADQHRSDAWVLSLAVAVWSGGRLSWLLARGEPRLFAFFFWLFGYVFLGVAPAVQIRADRPSTTTTGVLPSADTAMVAAVVLGIVAFEVGGVLGRAGERRTEVAPAASAADPAVDSGAARLLLVVGVMFTLVYVSRVGLVSLFSNREAAALAKAEAFPDPPVRAVIAALATYPVLVAVGASVLLRRRTSQLWARFAWSGGIVVGVALLAVVVNPLGTARYTVGTVVFALLVLAGAVTTAQRVRLTLMATVFGLFFLFPIADAFRRAEPSTPRSGFFAEYLGNPDYDAVWQIANALDYWRSGLAAPGEQLLGVVLFWVPRSLWAAKPSDTGVVLAEHAGYGFTNLSAPLWAEAIANGGLVALVLVFVLLGYAVVRLDARLEHGVRSSGVWLVAGAIFPAYSLILLRGSLLQATGAAVVSVASLLVVRGRQRARQER